MYIVRSYLLLELSLLSLYLPVECSYVFIIKLFVVHMGELLYCIHLNNYTDTNITESHTLCSLAPLILSCPHINYNPIWSRVDDCKYFQLVYLTGDLLSDDGEKRVETLMEYINIYPSKVYKRSEICLKYLRYITLHKC